MNLKKLNIYLVTVSFFLCFEVYAQEPIALSEYIENLRAEFVTLNSGKGKEVLPIYVSPIEIELTVMVKKTGKAGVKIYVVDASADLESSTTQKLSFTVSIGKPESSFMTNRTQPIPGTMFGWGGVPQIFTFPEGS